MDKERTRIALGGPDVSAVPSAKAAKAASRTREPLEQYLSDLEGCDVLPPEREIAIAQRIEALELAHWRALLSRSSYVGATVAAVGKQLSVPEELEVLVASARGRADKRAPKRWARELEAAAQRLRELDAARVALAAVDAEVRATLEGDAEARDFLAAVGRARRAQQAAKNAFASANLRLVVAMARRHQHGLLPLADLIQEGNLGLMRAVERFDYRRGFRFSTYAAWWIRHGFNRALSDKARVVRVPVHAFEDAQRIQRISRAALAQTGKLPSHAELAEMAGMDEERLTAILERGVSRQPWSLDRPLGEDGGATFLDTIQDPEQPDVTDKLDAASWSTQVAGMLDVLTPMEGAILRFRFGLDDGEELTLQEIGAKYNLSRERIRQLQEQALGKLRAELARRAGSAELSARAA